MTRPATQPEPEDHEARMNIGQVLDHLREEFPEISHTKLRFLEAEGIVTPQRTASNYRKYSRADLARLHLALRVQRDTQRPWKSIKEGLEARDRGLDVPWLHSASGPVVPAIAMAPDGRLPGAEAYGPGTSTLRLTRRELLANAEVDDEFLDQLESYGLVTKRSGSAPYDQEALVVTRTAAEIAAFGIEPRHLRAFKQAADREVSLIEQVTAPVRRSREDGAAGRAEDAATNIAALAVRLHATLVKTGLRHLR
ncbi:MAG: MerR family transcriptional regulator [Nocardioidaceae bacterium]